MAKTWKHAVKDGYKVTNNYGFMRITRANKVYPCGRWGYCDADPDHNIQRKDYYVSLVSGWRAQVSRPTGEIGGYRDGVPVEGRVRAVVPMAKVRRFHLTCIGPWIEWIASRLAEKPRGRQRTYTDADNKVRRKLIDRRKYLFRKIAAENHLWRVAELLQEVEPLHWQLGNRFNVLKGSPNAEAIGRRVDALRCSAAMPGGYQFCAPDHLGVCIHCGAFLARSLSDNQPP